MKHVYKNHVCRECKEGKDTEEEHIYCELESQDHGRDNLACREFIPKQQTLLGDYIPELKVKEEIVHECQQ